MKFHKSGGRWLKDSRSDQKKTNEHRTSNTEHRIMYSVNLNV
ncbi:hypothetical protein D1AOALGA4SA_6441 [Olavius algarvensis Delta 1 endosymbiont]|nr:hypothetical protein D1AOALGA4SA_6441 [Olavius algarvensis Delta 1 endosymbiont]